MQLCRLSSVSMRRTSQDRAQATPMKHRKESSFASVLTSTVRPGLQTLAAEFDGCERTLPDALAKPKAVGPRSDFSPFLPRNARPGRREHQRREWPRMLTNMCTLPGTIALEPLSGLPAVRDLIGYEAVSSSEATRSSPPSSPMPRRQEGAPTAPRRARRIERPV